MKLTKDMRGREEKVQMRREKTIGKYSEKKEEMEKKLEKMNEELELSRKSRSCEEYNIRAKVAGKELQKIGNTEIKDKSITKKETPAKNQKARERERKRICVEQR